MESEAALTVTVSNELSTAETLFEAARLEDKSQLNLLLNHFGAHIDAVNDKGLTALHLAVKEANVEAAEALLTRQANVETETQDGFLPLHLAIDLGDETMTACLLKHGAAPDAEVAGRTPLHEVVSRGNVEITRVLLDFGADANPMIDDLREPLYIAVFNRKHAITKLLLERGADPDSFFSEDPPNALHLAALNGDLEAIQLLLNGGAKIDARDFEGATPLFRAVAYGHLEAASTLLQRGANTRTWRADGYSVLELAEGNAEMLQLLQRQKVLQGPRIRNTGEAPNDEQEQPFTILKPSPPPADTERDKLVACQGFEAIAIDFFTSGEHEKMIPKSASVYELLYSHGPEAFKGDLEGKEPDFTWYHLPSNNMVWAETLIRRIIAERGGISAQMYEEGKTELDLAKHAAEREPHSSSARLSTLRSHCRRVPNWNPFSLNDNEDDLVVFTPFLNFETYSGYEKMANILEETSVTSRKSHLYLGSESSRGSHQRSDASRSDQPRLLNHRLFASRMATESCMSVQSSCNEPRQAFREIVQNAFQRFKGSMAEWVLGRSPRPSNSSMPSNSDIEGQNQQVKHDDKSASKNEDQTVPRGNEATFDIDIPHYEEHLVQQSMATPQSGQSVSAQAQLDTEEPLQRTTATSLSKSRSASEQGQTVDQTNDEAMDGTRSREKIGHNNESARSQNFSQRSQKSLPEPPTLSKKRTKRRRVTPPTRNLNEHLIRGYYRPGSFAYQPRRTLDQYGYADIETTSHRDDDQVVYRYAERNRVPDIKIFMVDQLWLWVLGKDTVVSCSPLQWDAWVPRGEEPRAPAMHIPKSQFLKWLGGHDVSQRAYPKIHPAMVVIGGQPSKRRIKHGHRSRKPKSRLPALEADMWPEINPDDPLSIPQRVTSHLFKQGRDPLRSVYDLVGIIMSSSVDVFNPRKIPDDFLFFDFFERSIGTVNDKVASHLREFKDALKELKDGQREHEVMDIAGETELMIEVEDIIDELHTLKVVLKDQERVVVDLNQALRDFSAKDSSPPEVETKTLKTHLLRIERMEEAAKKAGKSLHRLMDLKQKQASLAEAWYARESARDTARQGKTVIVFTVVTILFLPVSFIATVFSIDTNGYPLDRNEKIPFDYVMKCIMIIGLSLSIPLIIIAFNVDRIAKLFARLRGIDERSWRRLVDFSIVLSIVAAIFAPLWTSQLSMAAKVSTTIVLVFLALGLAIAAGLLSLSYSAIRSSVQEHSHSE